MQRHAQMIMFIILIVFFNSPVAIASQQKDKIFIECLKAQKIECIGELIKNGFDVKNMINFAGGKFSTLDVLDSIAYTNKLEYTDNYNPEFYVKVAEMLVDNGAVFTGNNLYYIVSAGCNSLVEYYLNQGLPAESKVEGESLMQIATSNNNLELIEILEKFGASRISQRQTYTLQLIESLGALRLPNEAEVNGLLAKGADINGINSIDVTPLGSLCRNPNIVTNVSCILFLLDRGADPNIQFNPHFSGLPEKTYPINLLIMWAGMSIATRDKELIENEFVRVFNKMLAKGFKVSAKDLFGRTPLHYSAKYDFIHAASVILQMGGKKTDKDKDGMTPYDLAESSEMTQLLQ